MASISFEDLGFTDQLAAAPAPAPGWRPPQQRPTHRVLGERDEDSSEALMGQIMLATTDFDVFMLMMKESRRQYDVKEKSRHK